MTLRSLRVALVISTLLASGVGLFAFLAAPELGSAYLRLVGPAGTALPLPTVDVALPLLRVAPGGPHQEPVTSPGAALAWLFVVLGPWAALLWTLRATDALAAMMRWVVALSIYLPVVAAIAVFVLAGLALPFGCL